MNFSDSHKAYLMAISLNDEPQSFAQASHDKKYKDAMRQEIWALERKWNLYFFRSSKRKRAIDSKWVYKIKYKPNVEVE